MSTEERESLRTEAFEMFGRHFVSLGLVYTTPNGNQREASVEQILHCSGFVLAIRGIWHFVTAGHVLKRLETLLTRAEIVLRHAFLVDVYGPARKTNVSTPFAFQEAAKTYVYDELEGLDFGLIRLSEYYRALLEANGILPFSEIDWTRQPQTFDAFFLFGLPSEPAAFDPAHIPVNAVLMPLDKVAEPPAEASATTYTRFFARLRDTKQMVDLKGMSGSPIFGLAEKGDGTSKYWLVGIQSGWFPSRLVIAATPLPVVGRLIEDSLTQLAH